MLNPLQIRKLLKSSSDAGNLKLGQVIHDYLITSQQVNREHVVNRNSLINLYSKCGKKYLARYLFDKISKKNVVSWGTIMACFSHNGQAPDVLDLFRDMVKSEKLKPNKYILATVLSSCSDCGSLNQGRQCHGYVLKSGLMFHHYVKNALVHLYTTCCEVEAAMKVVADGIKSDLCTYNSLLSGLLDQGDLIEVMSILSRIIDECAVEDWDGVTYVNVLGVSGSVKNFNLGTQVHARVIKNGMDFDIFVGCAVVDMYGKCGEVSGMRKVFDTLVVKNVVTWTALSTCYLQNKCFEEVLKLYLQMDVGNVVPNEYTFAVVINSCAGLSALGYGNSLHAHLEKIGMKSNTNVNNALIHMFLRCGFVEDAKNMFENMSYRDNVTWNVMISGFSYHGLGEQALNLFQEMLAAKHQPSYVTFVGVLSACAFLGRVDEGFHYLAQMSEEFGIEPGLEHYTCIIGLLGRAGRFDEAENFMRTSPIKWDIVAWRTLLHACHVHQNYNLGKKIADIVLCMNPDDVGTCILISNMHARAKRWDKIGTIRKLMRERNMKKEPGLSWTEIRNETHIFVSDDNKHVESALIREKVKKLMDEIKPLGYIPDTFSELHDVEDEQKEECLSFHSEKLAIAYGLMKTPRGSMIRVMKNLRMCDDCHSAAKFISKLTNRTLIVRDVNRFHCFRDGCCSCSDYW